MSAILYLLFLILDTVYAAPFFQGFLVIRLVVLAGHVALLGWLRRIKTNRGCTNIAMPWTIFDVTAASRS